MITTIWYGGLVIPITNALVFLYYHLGSNMALSILALTVIVKVLTLPLSISSIKSAKKQKALAPELAKIKERYKDNKSAMAEAQSKFLKEQGLNPASGCISMLLMIVPVFALNSALYLMLGFNSSYSLNSVLYDGLKFIGQASINFNFLHLNLGQPDPYLVLPILAAVCQFLLSKMMLPTVSKEERLARKTPEKTDDFMYNMQEQTLYLMPVMTILIGWKLASGLVLYWLLSSLLQLLQQLIMDGHLARWSKHLVKYVK